jgi:hypothetical protein
LVGVVVPEPEHRTPERGGRGAKTRRQAFEMAVAPASIAATLSGVPVNAVPTRDDLAKSSFVGNSERSRRS